MKKDLEKFYLSHKLWIPIPIFSSIFVIFIIFGIVARPAFLEDMDANKSANRDDQTTA